MKCRCTDKDTSAYPSSEYTDSEGEASPLFCSPWLMTRNKANGEAILETTIFRGLMVLLASLTRFTIHLKANSAVTESAGVAVYLDDRQMPASSMEGDCQLRPWLASHHIAHVLAHGEPRGQRERGSKRARRLAGNVLS